MYILQDVLQRISTLLRTIISEDKEDKELVSKKPEFLQEDLFGCADNFQGPDKLVGSGGGKDLKNKNSPPLKPVGIIINQRF